jgi:serine/threonine-protein kinase
MPRARVDRKRAETKRPSTRKADKPARAGKRSSIARKPEPARSPVGSTGTLRLNSRPWSQVSVDGHRIGNTPQMNLQLAAGTHTIKLVNPEFGLQKAFKISIKPGKTLTKIVDLQ